MKIKFYVLGLLLSFCLASCLNNSSSSMVESEEAVITKFYLYNDSINGISDYDFVIDNDSLLIYNYDSIAYGTRVDSLGFVVSPRFHAIYINDTIDFYAVDEIFLDFREEVKFTVVAADKKTSADYRVRVNVHKVDPDTFIWKGVKSEVFAGDALSVKALFFDGKLIYMAVVGSELVAYESENGADWREISLVGLDVDLKSVDLSGLVATDNKLAIVVDGKLYQSLDGVEWKYVETTGLDVERLMFAMQGRMFAMTSAHGIACLDGSEWVMLAELPSKFPVKGGAVLVAPAPSKKDRVFVVGGVDKDGNYLSSVWSSEDGLYWSDLTSGEQRFTPRAYAAIAQYGEGLMLFGGVDSEGKVVEDAQLFSKDFGLTWGGPSDKSNVGELYLPRYEHHAIVTPAGYIYLIGGRVSSAASINDVWQGLNYASLPGFKR